MSDAFDELTIAGAERLERTFGPNVALKAYRKLATLMVDRDTRARAALGAIRCAIAIGEINQIVEICPWWSVMGSGAYAETIIDHCKNLARRGHIAAAAELCKAEIERQPTAKTLYLMARLLEQRGDPSALTFYARAAEKAGTEPGAQPIFITCQIRRIERLALDPNTLPEAAQLAQALDPELAQPSQKLIIAGARMLASSRFVRASGISILEELARKGSPGIAEIAMRAAAKHADRYGDSLSAVEADRIAATLKHWPKEQQRDAALARLTALVRIAAARGGDKDKRLFDAAQAAPESYGLLCRAKAMAEGAVLIASVSAEEIRAVIQTRTELALSWLALDIVAALRAENIDDAIKSIGLATPLLVKTMGEAPVPFWAALALALWTKHPGLRAAALSAVERMLCAPGVPPPAASISMAQFGALLRGAGRAELAVKTLRWAALLRDSSASQDLGAELIRHGWSAALAGDRDAAIDALLEGKNLYAQALKAKSAPA